MRPTTNRKSLRRLTLLGFSILVMVIALGIAPHQAAACVSCLEESGIAFNYCNAHPGVGSYYMGCNFSISCRFHWTSANEIYQDECEE
jgi:hypothetical protein